MDTGKRTDLDPRTKIALTFALSCTSFALCDISCMLLLLLFTLLLLRLCGVRAGKLIKQAKGAVGMILLVFFLQCAAGRAVEGVMLSLRLLILAGSALLLLTSPLRDHLLALIQWKVPYELAYMIILAFRFFPLLRQEVLDVYYSMQLRGLELKKTSLPKRIRAYGAMCGPILWAALGRAKDTSIAMEARGFRSSEKRTTMRRLQMQKKDRNVLVLVLLFLAGLVIFSQSIRRKPPLQELGQEAILSLKDADTLTVSWSDDRLYEGQLYWGKEKLPARAVRIREGYYRYSADVPGLTAGRYTYTVGSRETRSPRGVYVHRPLENTFACLYMGDIQYSLRERDYELWGETLKNAWQANPDVRLGLFGGDMVENGADQKDWQAFLKNAEGVFSQIPMMTVIGNHETSVYPKAYLDMMALPEESPLPEECYSFTYGGCHFLALNSCLFMEERMAQADYTQTMRDVARWIRQDLQADTSPWKIAVMHHPMYPAAEDDKIYKRIRSGWGGLLSQGHVDLLLCGHQHVYMRTEPLQGIVSVMVNSGEKKSYYMDEERPLPSYVKAFQNGTPGYIRLDITAERMTLTAYEKEGGETDRYQWKK